MKAPRADHPGGRQTWLLSRAARREGRFWSPASATTSARFLVHRTDASARCSASCTPRRWRRPSVAELHRLRPDGWSAASTTRRSTTGRSTSRSATYVNRGITGAIVQRQPFGGWKNSVIGPGAKAGGQLRRPAGHVDGRRSRPRPGRAHPRRPTASRRRPRRPPRLAPHGRRARRNRLARGVRPRARPHRSAQRSEHLPLPSAAGAAADPRRRRRRRARRLAPAAGGGAGGHGGVDKRRCDAHPGRTHPRPGRGTCGDVRGGGRGRRGHPRRPGACRRPPRTPPLPARTGPDGDAAPFRCAATGGCDTAE